MSSIYPPENRPEWVKSASYIARGSRDEQCVLKPGSRKTREQTGLWVLNRTWQCRTDRADHFTPEDGDSDWLHKKLKVAGVDVTHGEGWRSEIQVRYTGIIDPKELRNKVKRNRSIVTETFVQEGTGISMFVKYLSPNVTTEWVAETCPTEATPFKTEPEPDCIIRKLEFSETTAEISLFRRDVSKLLALFGVNPSAERIDFARDQDGEIWVCSETVERVLVQYNAGVKVR